MGGGVALAKRKLTKMFNVQRISNCKRQQNIVRCLLQVMYIITHCCESPLHWMGLGGAASLWCLPRQPDPSRACSKATFFSSLQND